MLHRTTQVYRLSSSGIVSKCQLQRLQSIRQFHASRPNSLIAEALQLSHGVFQGLHTVTGLPWHLSIPLTAVVFKLSWLPVQYITGRNQQRQQRYAPLLQAWRKMYQKQAVQISPGGDEVAAQNAEKWVRERLIPKNKELTLKYKTMNPWSSLLLQLSFFPIWVLNADVIRRMSGDGRTLLGIVFQTEEKSVTGAIPPEPEFLEDQFLWLSDLVSGDPLWILYFAFGILQITNVWTTVGKSILERRRNMSINTQGLKSLRERLTASISEIFLAMAIISPAVLIKSETSAAIVLFLIGSVATQIVQKPLMRIAMGWKKGILPATPRMTALKPEYKDREVGHVVPKARKTWSSK